MKSAIQIGAWCALALVVVFTVCCLFTTAADRGDFRYRMAEIDCVKRGVDPFRIWNEEVVLPPYYSNNPARKSIPDGCTEMVSVYLPWEYMLMMPFSFLDGDVAWLAYSALSLIALCLLVPIAGYGVKRLVGEGFADVGLSAASALLVVCYPIWSNFLIGNHAVLMLFAAVLMAYFLSRCQDIPAALCWMVLMSKPQVGLIFAVPLMMRMKVRVGVMAVVSCLLLSLPVVWMCRASLVDLITEPAKASAFAFVGCGTWPRFLCGTFSQGGDILAGTVIGTIACLLMTWSLRRERDWFVFLMPAAVVSCCWTYTQSYSHAMGWFLAFVLVRELVRNPQSRFLWTMMGLSVLFLSRWFLAWHGLCNFAGWRFPMSDYAYDCLNSLNSTASLVLAAVFCVWNGRRANVSSERVRFYFVDPICCSVPNAGVPFR